MNVGSVGGGAEDIVALQLADFKQAVKLLDRGGTLIFANNFRRFKINFEAMKELQIKDLTKATLPLDFERNPKIHNCWKITKAN